MSASARPSLREAPFAYTLGLVPGLKEAATRLRDVLWDPAGRVSARAKELVFLRTSIVNHCDT